MGFIDTLTTKGPIEDSRIDYFPDAVPRDCVLYLPLARNRLRGDTFRSLDSYRHLCTVTGAVWTPQGRTFDGVNDIISVPNYDVIKNMNGMTALIWLKGLPQSKYIFSQYNTATANRKWLMSALGTGKIGVYISDDGTVAAGHFKNYETSGTPLDGAWHQFGISWDGATLQLWADGLVDPDPTKTTDAAITTLHVAASGITFAQVENLLVNSWFGGSLGPAHVFDRALTPQEIQRIYLATKDRYQ